MWKGVHCSSSRAGRCSPQQPDCNMVETPEMGFNDWNTPRTTEQCLMCTTSKNHAEVQAKECGILWKIVQLNVRVQCGPIAKRSTGKRAMIATLHLEDEWEQSGQWTMRQPSWRHWLDIRNLLSTNQVEDLIVDNTQGSDHREDEGNQDNHEREMMPRKRKSWRTLQSTDCRRQSTPREEKERTRQVTCNRL